ncbi:MAG: RNase adapter RapZ [Legionellales bacterium]|nr:RNase adapter RapZ [Legionellales bacterium]
MKVIMISGSSGAGKSICLHLLEDLGYYCIDNLPSPLIPALIEHIKKDHQKIAIGIDARNLPHSPDHFQQLIKNFKCKQIHCEIIYLDADNATLIKRFNETRRKHPLSTSQTSLAEAIAKEKEYLTTIAHLADLHIDTTHYNIHQLRDVVKNRVDRNNQQISLVIQSFGFKFGVPIDSDIVFDVRCLPNPYWQQELRPFTGKDAPIINFLSHNDTSQQMLDDILTYLEKWIPKFISSNRCYMTISIGCTGGQHRSVFITEQLITQLQTCYNNIQARHRELK